MSERLAPAVGETFGAYTIESVLGRGGMGAVFLATHERLERKVALKVVAPELAADDAFRARFLRESQLAASLDHPNVIPIYDADEIDGVLYLAMRYVSGPSLQALIRARGRLSLAETLRVVEQIARALDAAHRAGLVHRDVKPGNVLLAEPGDHAYLCDFGLARRASTEGLTRTGTFLGSIDYCAPEQIQGRPLDGRADVYSLGCVLFHCLAGHPPYPRETEFLVLQAHVSEPPPLVSSVRDDLPRALDDVIATAMAKHPDGRYATAGGLASAARAAGAGVTDADDTRAAPTAAPRVSSDAVTRVVEQRARVTGRRVWAIAVAVVTAALVAAAAASLLTRGGNGASSTTGPEVAKLQTFVDRVENVLEQSAAGRREIATALSGGFDCSLAPQHVARRIASVADNRQSILQQLATIGGPTAQADRVVTLLQQALQQSIEADRHYRDGFLATEAGRCPPPPNEDFRLARESDGRATAAKRRFAAAFGPLAKRFHRRAWSAAEI
jgi:predicted Ser/Thr protein kinase